MLLNLNGGTHYIIYLIISMGYVLGELKGEETIHKMLEDVYIENQELWPIYVPQDKACGKHMFH